METINGIELFLGLVGVIITILVFVFVSRERRQTVINDELAKQINALEVKSAEISGQIIGFEKSYTVHIIRVDEQLTNAKQVSEEIKRELEIIREYIMNNK